MDDRAVRQNLIAACLWLADRDLVVGTWGNLSVRLDDGNLLLTPSRVPYEQLAPEDLVVVDPDGNRLRGSRSPTSEMDVHRLIYRLRPDVGAIVHCHPVYGCAACATGEGIPPILEEMSQLLGGGIPCTRRYIRAGEHLALAQEVASAIGDRNAVLIRNHAPVCCGRDLDEALLCCQITEKAAKCYLAARDLGVESIPEDLVVAEHHRYRYQYGHEHT